MRCFGAVNPNFADQALIVAHWVNNIEFWKKSLSWFFVNAVMENKTQCQRIILFIKLIKRMEVLGKGQPSRAVRPLEHKGFGYLLQKLNENIACTTIICKYGLPAMLCYQPAVISRLDNATQFITTIYGSMKSFLRLHCIQRR
jgi:hypothetical protein